MHHLLQTRKHFRQLNEATAVFGLLLGYVASLWAAPSALIQIPTADVVEPHHAYFDVAGALPTQGCVHLSDWVVETCFGIDQGIELGFDTPLNTLEDGTFFFKKRLGTYADAAAAVGVNEINLHGSTWNPYLVLSSETYPLRGHAGADYTEHEWRAMLGVEYAGGEQLTWMVDWITGPEGSCSYGFNRAFGPQGLGNLMMGFIHRTSNREDLFYVNLGAELTF